jgi:hypothetical protein
MTIIILSSIRHNEICYGYYKTESFHSFRYFLKLFFPFGWYFKITFWNPVKAHFSSTFCQKNKLLLLITWSCKQELLRYKYENGTPKKVTDDTLQGDSPFQQIPAHEVENSTAVH